MSIRSFGKLIMGLGLGVSAGALSLHGEVVIENAACRLVISDAAEATSLVVKATGEECLATDVAIPFASILQNRPYDNELKLIYPAKSWRVPANRVTQEGDLLKLRFRDEFFVLKVRVRLTGDYIAFTPEGTDYEVPDFGDKRPTEIDGIEFLRLPIRSRTRYGKCANVAWDEKAALAVMALDPATEVSGDVPEGTRNWRRFAAGADARIGLWGHGAALFACRSAEFLDHVDALERDYDMPRGVKMRRDPLHRASYWFMSDISPANMQEHIAWMKKGGFRLGVISYTAFARTCGHFDWRSSYPNGMDDLKRVTAEMRKAGITPGIHIHYCKVSTNDLYVTNGRPDPRLATASEVTLARAVGPGDTEFFVEGNPDVLRMERGRRLILFGNELVSYEGVSSTRPYRLTGVVRGLHGSRAVAHAAHEYGRQPDVDDWPYFIRIDPRTDIQDEIADRLAAIIDGAGFEFIYFDGAEDVPPPFWHYVPMAQQRVWSKLKRKPRAAEGALKSHWGWHMLSRGNAFDSFIPERTRNAAETYIIPCARDGADDFSAVNFGWVRPYYPGESLRHSATSFLVKNAPVSVTRGTTAEDLDYLCQAAEQWKCPLSVKGVLGVFRRHAEADALMSVLKKWEDEKWSTK